MKHIMITGVSSGIGRHAAQYFLHKGWRVFGSVRLREDAADLIQTFKDTFVPVLMDVTDYAEIDAAADTITRHLDGARLDLLVNNAGVAVYGPLMHVPMAEFDHQMRVNVSGILKVTQAFLPLLSADEGIARQGGTIVNIGSVSGTMAPPFLGPYCASKYAVEALSDCMRRELVLLGIRVILLQPASIQSSIWEKAQQASTHGEGTPFEQYLKQRDRIVTNILHSAMPADVVNRVLWRIALGRARKPRYLITRFNLLYRLSRRLPDQWVDALYLRRLRKLQVSPD